MSKKQTVKQSKRTRRTFNSEFKVSAVKMDPAHDHRACEAARQLDINRIFWDVGRSAYQQVLKDHGIVCSMSRVEREIVGSN